MSPLPRDTARRRLDAVRALLDSGGADGLLVSGRPDVLWLTGFSGSNGVVVVRPDAVHLFTDGRYGSQAADEAPDAEVHAQGYDLFGQMGEALALQGLRAVVVQNDQMTFADGTRLRAMFPDVSWEGAVNVLGALRAPKEPWEVDALVRALRISEEALADVTALLRPGLTEREIAAELVYRQRSRGATGMAFDPIVAAGPNAALPHAKPTARAVRAGELLLMDFGCIVDGYRSDITRMAVIGEPDADAAAAFNSVLRALRASRKAARSGMAASALDAVARDELATDGLRERFTHSLGHGVGLDVHEWPTVSWRSDAPLPNGAVVTLEPGVYLPGQFGVRIEDMVRLTTEGNERLTAVSDELIRC